MSGPAVVHQDGVCGHGVSGGGQQLRSALHVLHAAALHRLPLRGRSHQRLEAGLEAGCGVSGVLCALRHAVHPLRARDHREQSHPRLR